MSKELTERCVLGEFELRQHVATGGMGEVWLAHHHSGAPVAIKLLTAGYAARPEFQRRFRREVQSTSRLREPRIVRIYDYGFTPADTPDAVPRGVPYYVMEWAESGSASGANAPTTWEGVATLLVDVLAALAHAHARGILHRDIKADNVLYVTRNGARRHALTDFGIAHALDRNTATDSDDLTSRNAEEASGTPLYMAPEQFLGYWRDYGPWTDLYAVGILAWRLVCGKPPFLGATFWELAQSHLEGNIPALDPNMEVPEGLEPWIRWLTSRDARERPRSAAQALNALLKFAPVTSVVPARDPIAQIRPGAGLVGLGLPGIVGRDREQALLTERLAAVESDRVPRAIVLTGPAGSGKSRLARWLLQSAIERGDCVGFEATHSRVQGVRHGLGYMLSRHWRCGGLDVAETTERLVELLDGSANLEEREPELLAELIAERGSDMTTSLRADQRIELVRRAIQREAGDGLGLVFLDDAHWSDDAFALTSSLIEHGEGLLIVLTVRDEDVSDGFAARLARLEEDGSLVRLPVANLDPTAMQALVRHEIGLAGPAARAVEERSGGSPLFAVQLTEFWMREGLLEHVDGGLQFALQPPTLPPDLLALWGSRIARIVAQFRVPREVGMLGLRLPVDADTVRDRLELAAILGDEVDFYEWELACELAQIGEAPFLLEELHEHGLTSVDDRGFRFTHGLLRDALLASSRERQRFKALSMSAARALTSRYPATHPDLARRVARHFADAGAYQLAATCLEEALRHAKQRLEAEHYGELAALADQTLEALGAPPADPRRISARAYFAVSLVLSAQAEELDEARALLEELEATARVAGSDGALCDVLTIAGWASIHLGDKAGGAEKLSQALAIAPTDEARGLALTFMAHVQSHLRNYEAVHRYATEVVERHDVPAWRVRAHEVLAHNELEAHEPQAAEAHLHRALECAKRGGTPQLLGHLNNLLGFVADFREDFATAEQHHRAAIALMRVFAPRSASVNATQEYLARAILQQDRVDEAYSELLEIRERERVGQRGLYMHLEDALFACAAAQGRFEDAGELYEAAFTYDGGFPPNALHSRALIYAARAFAGHGELDRARDVYERTAGLIEGITELDHHLALIQRELSELPAT